MSFDLWVHNNVFTFQWWLLGIFLIAPWFLWWKLVDKQRLAEILLYGLMVLISASYLDEIGSELTLWVYPYKFLPVFKQLTTANFTMLPIIYMLIYQYFERWKSFLTASILMAIAFLFLGEALRWLGIYRIYHWNHIYSFSIYITMALFLRWLTKTIVSIQQKEVR